MGWRPTRTDACEPVTWWFAVSCKLCFCDRRVQASPTCTRAENPRYLRCLGTNLVGSLLTRGTPLPYPGPPKPPRITTNCQLPRLAAQAQGAPRPLHLDNRALKLASHRPRFDSNRVAIGLPSDLIGTSSHHRRRSLVGWQAPGTSSVTSMLVAHVIFRPVS